MKPAILILALFTFTILFVSIDAESFLTDGVIQVQAILILALFSILFVSIHSDKKDSELITQVADYEKDNESIAYRKKTP